MRKRQSIVSVYCISVSHQCIASVPTFETSNPSVLLHIRHFLLPIRPFLAGWKLLPQHPRASMSSVVSLVMSLVMWGGCDSMNILLERERSPFFTSVSNLSVEMGDFTDKLLTLNYLSVRTSLFTDKPVIWSQPLSGLCASVSKQVDSQEHI